MPEAPIFRAAREGNEGEVNRLLDETPALLEVEGSFRLHRRGHVIMRQGVRPLMRAAECGQLGVVRLLLRRGANIEATDNRGETVLHCAAGGGYDEVVGILVKQGAQINIMSRGVVSMTPFMVASVNGHVSVVRLLLQHSGMQELHERDGRRRTALHCAALGGHEEMVRCLLFGGVDPSLRDNDGRTPRALAQYWQRADCVAVFEWWDSELKRRALLHRAISLHKAYTTQRDQPTSQVPTYLEARVAAGHAVPFVEVMSPQSEHEKEEEENEEAGESGKKGVASERGDAQGAEAGEEEMRHAVVEYVVKGLNEQLVTELMEGFHGP